MGSYNSQYQSYYSTLQRGNRNRQYGNRVPSKGNARTLNKNFLVRRLFQELIGVLCLFLIVLICKIVKTPQTIQFYGYCKNVVSYNYDYKSLYQSVRNVNINELSSSIEDYIDKLKSDITGEKTIKEKVISEFIPPLNGKIISAFGNRVNPVTKKSEFHYGVDIEAAVGTEVKSCSGGYVKFIGEDDTLGKYVLIDHGIGIETKYADLKEIKVKKDDKVKEGDTIALSGNGGESASPQLHFELLYMGESKNPEEYIRLTYIP